MTDWIKNLVALVERGTPGVVVTVAAADGSTPREAGAKMIVTAADARGSIGGGHLEYKTIEEARRMMAEGAVEPMVRSYPLGPELGQCCGGYTSVLFEPMAANGSPPDWLSRLAGRRAAGAVSMLATCVRSGRKMVVGEDDAEGTLGDTAADARLSKMARRSLAALSAGATLTDGAGATALGYEEGELYLLEPVAPAGLVLYLFGAGHVGKALVSVLAGLPCEIVWVDSRADQFPSQVPDNVRAEVTDEAESAVERAPAAAYFLVMTHSHQLDYEICEAILCRGDFAYLGLIGSRTKRKRFEQRLSRKGIAPEALVRVTCPIGIEGLSGKHPREIAIAAAAEILQIHGTTADVAARAPVRARSA
jgi:xanthine dehydrogenase accessory factor